VSKVFADTSALFALLDANDDNHQLAADAFQRLRARNAPLLSTSFVLVETYALAGRRLGLDAGRRFRSDFAPLLEVVWVDRALNDAGLDLLVERRTRRLSLVDAVSFVTMRQQHVSEAFVFDPHFEQEGFSVVAG
jgi:uncharacterized protein